MIVKPRREDREDGGGLFEELVYNYLSSRLNLSKEEILKLAAKKQELANGIPVDILCDNVLSSLEAIVKYLRENKNYSYARIALILRRNPKTLAVSYAVAKRKKPLPFAATVEFSKVRIPFSAFDVPLSILESICSYLKSQGHSNAEIARLLCKDQKTIWTVCKRAEQKLSQKSTTYSGGEESSNHEYY